MNIPHVSKWTLFRRITDRLTQQLIPGRHHAIKGHKMSTRELWPVKFELTDETKEVAGVTLYRIRATEAIPSAGVKVGDLGGWVESTHLEDGSPRITGNAWGADEAAIHGDARSSDNAVIYGNARIFGTGTFTVTGSLRATLKSQEAHTTQEGAQDEH